MGNSGRYLLTAGFHVQQVASRFKAAYLVQLCLETDRFVIINCNQNELGIKFMSPPSFQTLGVPQRTSKTSLHSAPFLANSSMMFQRSYDNPHSRWTVCISGPDYTFWEETVLKMCSGQHKWSSQRESIAFPSQLYRVSRWTVVECVKYIQTNVVIPWLYFDNARHCRKYVFALVCFLVWGCDKTFKIAMIYWRNAWIKLTRIITKRFAQICRW